MERRSAVNSNAPAPIFSLHRWCAASAAVFGKLVLPAHRKRSIHRRRRSIHHSHPFEPPVAGCGPDRHQCADPAGGKIRRSGRQWAARCPRHAGPRDLCPCSSTRAKNGRDSTKSQVGRSMVHAGDASTTCQLAGERARAGRQTEGSAELARLNRPNPLSLGKSDSLNHCPNE
jgi:hypothetical protein